MKSVISNGDDHAILAECERGEDAAVQEYKKAMEEGLNPPLREIVSNQYSEVKAAHDCVKNLRDTAQKD